MTLRGWCGGDEVHKIVPFGKVCELLFTLAVFISIFGEEVGFGRRFDVFQEVSFAGVPRLCHGFLIC